MPQKEIINDFLVRVFNSILRQEAKALRGSADGKLSVNEYHVIEAVAKTVESGTNTVGEVAKLLGITRGSLTVSVNTLEKKGFLRKERDQKDKRTVRIFCTEDGVKSNAFHKEFHNRMAEQLIQELDEEELPVMINALRILEKYFFH